jgi:hypothetical protein
VKARRRGLRRAAHPATVAGRAEMRFAALWALSAATRGRFGSESKACFG